MEGVCCTSSSPSGAAETSKRKYGRQDKPYRGIRMRKWGKWVAEIREPNKRSRIWLGSYSSPVAAARAYDTALICLRGPSARLNFPECVLEYVAGDLSAAAIRKKATEVGARVDAMQAARDGPKNTENTGRVVEKPDLNEYPIPDMWEEN